MATGRKKEEVTRLTRNFAFSDVVQRLRNARLEKGWTQQRLADSSGIARANIARLEAGHAPRVDTIELLARALSLPLAKLFETSESATKLRDLNQSQLRAGASRVQETLKALRQKGIVGEKGKRVNKELPSIPEITQRTEQEIAVPMYRKNRVGISKIEGGCELHFRTPSGSGTSVYYGTDVAVSDEVAKALRDLLLQQYPKKIDYFARVNWDKSIDILKHPMTPSEADEWKKRDEEFTKEQQKKTLKKNLRERKNEH